MSADSDFPVLTILDKEPSLFDDGIIFHAVKVDEDKWVQVAHNPTATVGSEVIRVKPQFSTYAEIVDEGFGEYDAIDNAVAKAMEAMGLTQLED